MVLSKLGSSQASELPPSVACRDLTSSLQQAMVCRTPVERARIRFRACASTEPHFSAVWLGVEMLALNSEVPVAAGSAADDPMVRGGTGPVPLCRISRHSNLTALRAEWRRLFRAPPPLLPRDLLMRGVAYRMQELQAGG